MINQNITFSPALSALYGPPRPQVSLGSTSKAPFIVAGLVLDIAPPVIGGIAGYHMVKKHRVLGAAAGALAGVIITGAFLSISALRNMQ